MKYYGRDTVMSCVAHDPLHPRYAVVPHGKCCAYCTMIASRGFDYHPANTARAALHDNCGCMPCPSWEAKRQVIAGYDPDAMRDQYQHAVDAVEGKADPPAWAAKLDAFSQRDRILEAMRRLKPDEYTDGVHGYTHDKATKSKASVGDLNLATWQDYRASLAERFIAANNLEWKMPPEQPAPVPDVWIKGLPSLTPKHWAHILYGDRQRDRKTKKYEYGGGHLSGYGWIAGKPMFPSRCNPEGVALIIRKVIETGDKVGMAILGSVDGVEYCVRLGPKGNIITAFPVVT
ncbi:EndoU domain-containing protein [Bifidobacterium gallicum]|uniref:Bacterial EndoU nuclease n=1 Tax=Bifidobacterium gallicum DSM 20093 = LMG 11596 TaxID=561180 RepID=D1NSM5_9BIFI|nr:EndoU domain-containing protein [Bifidobacterium gallicum]EFA23677.1 hypothetical protein BIFGAL_02784 [Bifidobacterium gallicum DSM 20093 = LMG 11596]KFI58736.1 bacterial EndoU nuclease [Bifidobacterium gallicum DSM 20093 = LMG 11596]